MKQNENMGLGEKWAIFALVFTLVAIGFSFRIGPVKRQLERVNVEAGIKAWATATPTPTPTPTPTATPTPTPTPTPAAVYATDLGTSMTTSAGSGQAAGNGPSTEITTIPHGLNSPWGQEQAILECGQSQASESNNATTTNTLWRVLWLAPGTQVWNVHVKIDGGYTEPTSNLVTIGDQVIQANGSLTTGILDYINGFDLSVTKNSANSDLQATGGYWTMYGNTVASYPYGGYLTVFFPKSAQAAKIVVRATIFDPNY
jgi:hypothetical protein